MRFLTFAILFLIVALLIACSERVDEPDWSYSGENGPANWASLSEEYAACDEGIRQSPINLADYAHGNGPELEFDYNGDAISAVNTGRQVSYKFDNDSELHIGEDSFHLKYAHLHAPAEHALDGLLPAAELHLVHADDDENLAVVGVVFVLRSQNDMAQALLEAAPDVGEKVTEGLAIEAEQLTPAPGPYFFYEGSLTTPPCSESVDWYVMAEPLPIRQSQVDVLWELHGGPNSRPVQPLRGREIRLVGA